MKQMTGKIIFTLSIVQYGTIMSFLSCYWTVSKLDTGLGARTTQPQLMSAQDIAIELYCIVINEC